MSLSMSLRKKVSVMRYTNIFTAALLTSLSLSAMAQDAAAGHAASPAKSQGATTVNAVPAQSAASSTTGTGTPKLPSGAQLAPPRTMDEVVDRAIAREHALMAFLKDRTPLVETYLQNLKPDKELGSVPAEDHYFLGRMDMGETVDRRDYLA